MVPKAMLDMVLEQLSMLREQIARMQETIYVLTVLFWIKPVFQETVRKLNELIFKDFC